MATYTGSQSSNTFNIPGEYLAFRLGSEEYGVDIQKVQELRGYEPVSTIAGAPEYLKGVVNLRGVIVPIFDMRIRLKLGSASYNDSTVVIVLHAAGRTVGVVVDGVSDVTALTPAQIKPAPDFHTDINANYVTGLGLQDERMLILINMDLLLLDEVESADESVVDSS